MNLLYFHTFLGRESLMKLSCSKFIAGDFFSYLRLPCSNRVIIWNQQKKMSTRIIIIIGNKENFHTKNMVNITTQFNFSSAVRYNGTFN